MKMYLINHVNLTAADIGKTEFGLVEAAFPTEVEACAHIHNTLIPHFETDITLEYIRSMGKEAFEKTYHFDKTVEEDESWHLSLIRNDDNQIVRLIRFSVVELTIGVEIEHISPAAMA